MKTLEEIKNEVARDHNFISSWELLDQSDWHTINEAVNEVSKRYAIEVSRAALKNASKNATAYESYSGEVLANKSSITDERNIPKI